MTITQELDQMLTLDALRWAWHRVRENGGAPGADAITLERFERVLDTNLLDLASDVRSGTYVPERIRFVEVAKPGKIRRLAILSVRDRVLQRAALDLLGPPLDRQFRPSSFAYRPNRSLQDAVERIVSLRNRGLTFLIDADLRDCFGSLDHTLLLRFLDTMLPHLDPRIRQLVDIWIRWPGGTRQDGTAWFRKRGILQGAPVSPLLCNLYLHQFDTSLARRRLSLVRYADDFVVLCRSREHADHAMRTVEKIVSGLKLEMNPRKTRIASFDQGFDFLGVHFEGDEYTYVTEGKRFIVDDLPPDWFFYHADGYD
jgi:CRISPR-associated protein Cas1